MASRRGLKPPDRLSLRAESGSGLSWVLLCDSGLEWLWFGRSFAKVRVVEGVLHNSVRWPLKALELFKFGLRLGQFEFELFDPLRLL